MAAPAGWYADPADASRDRWWDGAQWSETLRPTASVPVLRPVDTAQRPDGSFPDAFFDSLTIDVTDRPAPPIILEKPKPIERESAVWSANSFAGRPAQRRIHIPQARNNPAAIVGFVMGIAGFGLISLIVSMMGLKKAQSFVDEGDLPSGRLLAKWGIGLSIATMVYITLALGLWFAIGGSLFQTV